MHYVDGFVLPVPRKKLAAYRRMAKYAGRIWMECGALQYVECVADDVKPGKWTSFPQSVKLRKGEVVVFSYIMDPKNMPFDGKRMFWGGFRTMVEY
jgi:uncharacterized protein YbaA (DUF1428 family)